MDDLVAVGTMFGLGVVGAGGGSSGTGGGAGAGAGAGGKWRMRRGWRRGSGPRTQVKTMMDCLPCLQPSSSVSSDGLILKRSCGRRSSGHLQAL